VAGSSLRRLLLAASRALPLRLVPLDAILRFSQRATSALAGLLFLRDWRLQSHGRPQFFKHQINLSRWSFEPSRWSFSARGVYARERMFKGCSVLDLCCGDGSFSYLFFSDIAGKIDAVDNDPHALAYARKYCSSPVISYHKIDIVSQPLPASVEYDFVVWNAAICYFREEDIRRILEKIVRAGKRSAILNGMLPRANRWVDHKTEFADCASLERLLREYFDAVAIREVDEGANVTFYFQASSPRNNLLTNPTDAA
jgi:SAM-dependent methyltransferase